MCLRKDPAVRAKDAPWEGHSMSKETGAPEGQQPWDTYARIRTPPRDHGHGKPCQAGISWKTVAREGPVTCENKGM